MTERLTKACLLLGHFLLLTRFFWAGGVHRQGRDVFVSLPALALPTPDLYPARILIFTLGILCAIQFYLVLSQRRCGPWMLILLAGESYLFLLDIRLFTRFAMVLALLTLASEAGGQAWTRYVYPALVLTGPYWWAGLVCLPLVSPRLSPRGRNALLVLTAAVAILQSYLTKEIDCTILAVGLLLPLYEKPPDSQPNKPATALLLALTVLISVAAYSPMDDRSMTLHTKQGEQLHLVRTRGKLSIEVDGNALPPPWTEHGRLLCNPNMFLDYPELLDFPTYLYRYPPLLETRRERNQTTETSPKK